MIHNELKTKIFSGILRLGRFTASELCEHTGLEARQVYGLLSRLKREGVLTSEPLPALIGSSRESHRPAQLYCLTADSEKRSRLTSQIAPFLPAVVAKGEENERARWANESLNKLDLQLAELRDAVRLDTSNSDILAERADELTAGLERVRGALEIAIYESRVTVEDNPDHPVAVNARRWRRYRDEVARLRAELSVTAVRTGHDIPLLSTPYVQLRMAHSRLDSVPPKVLIVDSAAATRRELREMLADEYEPIEAATASEAIGIISTHRVDVGLVDLDVREIGAMDFCRMVKKASATQFVPLFVTGEATNPATEVRAIEAGADGFIKRPLERSYVHTVIDGALRHRSMIESLDDSEVVLFSLAQSVEERDPHLSQHCQRLALMSAAMGVASGLPSADVLSLQRGGYLHDIGKVAIPDQILFRPGPLTPEEWEIMKSHAERGERICGNIRSLASVLPIIRHHHEKWDGSGYPDGLKGEEIPLLARVLQIADIYDALTTARPYKVALTPEQALGVIREEATIGWRDPALVDLLQDILPMLTVSTKPNFERLSLHGLAETIQRYRREKSRRSKTPGFEIRTAFPSAPVNDSSAVPSRSSVSSAIIDAARLDFLTSTYRNRKLA